MPLSPFVGLSIAFHIAVILVSRIIERVYPNRVYKDKADHPVRAHIISAIMVICIFSYVAVSTSALIASSLADKNATPRLVSSFVIDTRNYIEHSSLRTELQNTTGELIVLHVSKMDNAPRVLGEKLRSVPVNVALAWESTLDKEALKEITTR
jgi:hypothetical protein